MLAGQRASESNALLVEIEVADLLKISPRTLQAWRTSGQGPAFVRAGRAIRYSRIDIAAWIEGSTVAPARSAAVRPGSR
jgi:predicted DNA-binding transcriptional regulator AlpA